MTPRTCSRRHLLVLAFGTMGAVGCDADVQAEPGPRRASVRRSAPPSPAIPAPAVHPTVPLGTEVPFDPNDRVFVADRDQFEDKRPPRPGDWMAEHAETGMTFDEYRQSRAMGRIGTRCVLVLAPLGAVDSDLLAQLSEFTSAYFDSRVRVAPPLPLGSKGRRLRKQNGATWVQFHTGTLLEHTLAPRLPPDAVAMLGITLVDLYPEASWNFVFGEASLDERVGVYSLNRYFPAAGHRMTSDERRLGLLRSFKVLAHETGHMFGLVHCRRYECVMNGTNSLDETDRSPLELCAVCLKMLDYNLRFDVPSRYRRLLRIYERAGLGAEARWLSERLTRIDTPVR